MFNKLIIIFIIIIVLDLKSIELFIIYRLDFILINLIII